MSLIRLENVNKSFGTQPILEGISLRVEESEKIGLIGRNGTGKSTIFRLIMGETEPDSGVIERMRRARVACLAQLPQLDPDATIFDVVMHSFRELLDLEHELSQLEETLGAGDNSVFDKYSELQDEFQQRGGYTFRHTAKRVLHGLGFTVQDFELKVSALSGGQRTRLMLALVLLEDADLLLLDEPENHLDIEAREWLEGYLRESPRAFVMVSHDRAMLNAVVTRIFELERREVRIFGGNYEFYAKQKALLRDQQQKAYDRQQEYIQKEMTWINRFGAKATKAAQAQSRLKRLETLERVEAPPPELSEARFSLGEVVRSSQVVIEARGLGIAYGPLVLYRGLDLQIERGERIGIIGPNGAGKTTLLRQLAGLLEGAEGTVTLGHKVRLGFYQQHHEALNPANDILREVQSARPAWTPEQVRSFLGRFLFTGEDVFKPVTALSGGELSRVAIAKLVLSEPNVLLLDEPTNHLDIASREALEAAIEDFPGTLIVVSHDRALVDRLVDRLIIVEKGTARVHWGNYSHYKWKHAEEVAAAEQAQAEKTAADVLKIRRDQPKGKAGKVERERSRSKQRKQLEETERHIEEMEELVAEYEAKFAAVDPADFPKMQQLTSEYDGLKKDLEALYAEWEALAEEMKAT